MTLSLTARRARPVLAWLGSAALVVLGLTGTARAALGGSEFSMQLDQARANGDVHTTSFAAYDRHEITTLDGASIHEFTDRSGGPVSAGFNAGPKRCGGGSVARPA